MNRDVAGNFSYRVYDQLGRTKYEVDAERYVTQHNYDRFGNEIGTAALLQCLRGHDEWHARFRSIHSRRPPEMPPIA